MRLMRACECEPALGAYVYANGPLRNWASTRVVWNFAFMWNLRSFSVLVFARSFAPSLAIRSCWTACTSSWSSYFKVNLIYIHLPMTPPPPTSPQLLPLLCVAGVCRQLNREVIRRVHTKCVKLREMACRMACCCSFRCIINVRTLVLRTRCILLFGISSVQAAAVAAPPVRFERTQPNQFRRCVQSNVKKVVRHATKPGQRLSNFIVC